MGKFFDENWFLTGEKINSREICLNIGQVLNQSAKEFFENCGARYGSDQQFSDFCFPFDVYLPETFRNDPNQKFQTIDAEVQSEDSTVYVSLWIRTYNKNGDLSKRATRLAHFNFESLKVLLLELSGIRE